jgi:hypothetical protein
MAHGHELNAHGLGSHELDDTGGVLPLAHHGPRALPADLSAPPMVAVWRTRSLIVGAVFLVLSVIFLFTVEGRQHFLRALLLSWFMMFSLCGGGLCVLMLQYVSGGKWGLMLRRPLEAMTRTLPLLIVALIPILLFGKGMYLWLRYPTGNAVSQALADHLLTPGEAHALDWKRVMLSPLSGRSSVRRRLRLHRCVELLPEHLVSPARCRPGRRNPGLLRILAHPL